MCQRKREKFTEEAQGNRSMRYRILRLGQNLRERERRLHSWRRARGTNVGSQPNVRGPRGATSWPSTRPIKRRTPSCSHLDGLGVVVFSCKIDVTFASTSVRHCLPKQQQNEQMSSGSGVHLMQPHKNYTIVLCMPLAALLARFDSMITSTWPPAFSGICLVCRALNVPNRTTRVSPVWPLATATCARRHNAYVTLSTRYLRLESTGPAARVRPSPQCPRRNRSEKTCRCQSPNRRHTRVRRCSPSTQFARTRLSRKCIPVRRGRLTRLRSRQVCSSPDRCHSRRRTLWLFPVGRQ